MVPRTMLSSLVAALAMVALVAGPAAAHDRDGKHRSHHGKHGWHDGGKHHGKKQYGATTLKLDPGAIAALTGLGVTPAPISPAKALAADELAFPITNRFKSALRSGVIEHRGGISLTAGSTTVELTDFDIEVADEVLTALVGGARVPVLDLDFSTARVSWARGGLSVGPVGATLTEVAAGALDDAFGLPAGTVPAGLKLGDATVNYKRLW
jgi:hypothetical protein